MNNETLKQVQGKYALELFFSDDRIFLNYWDYMHGDDICCQVKDGKILKFVYSPKEVEESESEEKDIEVFKQEEITITDFIQLDKKAIQAA